MDIRCKSKKHGVLDPKDGVLEIKCDSRFCGHAPGTVVLHRFDVTTGELVETVQFKDPGRRKADAAHHRSAAVRSA